MGAQSATVLVVDDEPDLVDLYATWLASEYEVRTAHSGAEALERLDDSVDYVLLDRRMPDRSGDDVLESIRARGVDSRVAMVTAVEPDYDILEMGFDGYVVKPVRRDELLSLVDTLASVDSYDDVIQRYYRLASKKAALESTKSDAELATGRTYSRLLEEFEAVEAQADARLEELGDDAFSLL